MIFTFITHDARIAHSVTRRLDLRLDERIPLADARIYRAGGTMLVLWRDDENTPAKKRIRSYESIVDTLGPEVVVGLGMGPTL